MKRIWGLFLSLKTAFGLFLAGIAICLIGSLTLPSNLAFFSGIDDSPLFRWLSEAGEPAKTWWIYALIAQMSLLSLCTVLCTADALIGGMGRRNLMLKLSPQVMHIGVLLVLFGHLLTSSMGTRADITVIKGEEKPLNADTAFRLMDLEVTEDEKGYYSDWIARLELTRGGKVVKEAVLRPARPVYFGGTGLYFKTISMEGEHSALIRAVRDPGVLWALAGGALLSLGALWFLYARFEV